MHNKWVKICWNKGSILLFVYTFCVNFVYKLYTWCLWSTLFVDQNLCNVGRDFITSFTKYKTYLFHVIILSFFIIILSYKEIRLSFKENKTFSVIIILSFKEIRLFCLIIILSLKENKTFCLITVLSFKNIKLSV